MKTIILTPKDPRKDGYRTPQFIFECKRKDSKILINII